MYYEQVSLAPDLIEVSSDVTKSLRKRRGWIGWSDDLDLGQPSGTCWAKLCCVLESSSTFLSALVDNLFPERCRVCSIWVSGQLPRLATAVCLTCWRELCLEKPIIDWCYLPDGRAIKVVSAGRYEGALKRLVYKLKYDGDRLIALDLSRLIFRAFSMLADDLNGMQTVMVPVPLHSQRFKSRGFNQAEIIAHEVASKLHIRLSPRALKRLRNTKPQHGLSRSERQVNLRGAFLGQPTKLGGKTVILVDDIFTSGATIIEAASEVLSKGASAVFVLTVARAVCSGH